MNDKSEQKSKVDVSIQQRGRTQNLHHYSVSLSLSLFLSSSQITYTQKAKYTQDEPTHRCDKMSSLASQLQQIASLDASRLTSKYGTPSSKSYLFPAKVAAEHDLDSIFTLAQSGFEELLSLDPGMEVFEDDLFSEKAKRTDRMMLSQEENDALDRVLGRCLRRLGKWVGVMAGGKCIEWLVRRFRLVFSLYLAVIVKLVS